MGDYVDSESSSDLDGEIGVKPEVGVLGLDSSSVTSCSKPNGEGIASSSQSHLRSYFVAMGFSPTLVDKVLEENGEGNADSLLEALFAYSAIQKPSPHESSDSLEEMFGARKDGSNSSEFTVDGQEVEELDTASDAEVDKRSSLLKMNFSVEEVDFAISKLGEEAPVHEFVDFIVAAQIAQNSGKDVTNPAHGNEEAVTETLFGTMDKTLRLLEMGFSGDEISSALDACGAEVPVDELADSIFASRIADTCVKDEKWQSTPDSMHNSYAENDRNPGRTKAGIKRPLCGTSVVKTEASSSDTDVNAEDMDLKELLKGKKPKPEYEDYMSAYFGSSMPEARLAEPEFKSFDNSTPRKEFHKPADNMMGEMKIPQQFSSNTIKTMHEMVGKTPYFFYGNVMDISHDTWARLSQFLYSITPEFVNTQFFSALNRKEGYIHNLPTENRSHIYPRSPMTIEDVMPQAKKWWPSWDTRKQLSCITSETRGISQLCERLEKILINTRGMFSKEQQTDIIYHCKTMNLMWVGEHKLSPLEPEHLEVILGYPSQHTKVWVSNLPERLRQLKYCFQTDTLGYHLSALKQLFPSGLTVLSLHSGIGGAEVALHRLGLRLKVVVSVEASETNQRMLKKWWQNTEQRGELVQIDDTKKLTSNKLKRLMEEFGGFDFVICQNPCTDVSSSSKGSFDHENQAGLDFTLFFEFVRVLQCIRSTMERRR